MSRYLDLLFPPPSKQALLEQLAAKDDDNDTDVNLMIIDDDGGCCANTLFKVIHLAYGGNRKNNFLQVSRKLAFNTIDWESVSMEWPNVVRMGRQDVTHQMEMDMEDNKITHFIFIRMKTHDERGKMDVEDDIVGSLKSLVEQSRI